jgi:heme-degrading monooxygenase HmoA
MILIVWEYRVKPERTEDFEIIYGPNGEWVNLFRRYPGYLNSELLRKKGEPQTYITIDRWNSEDDYHKFLFSAKEAYDRIDALCETLTIEEIKLGVFEE